MDFEKPEDLTSFCSANVENRAVAGVYIENDFDMLNSALLKAPPGDEQVISQNEPGSV